MAWQTNPPAGEPIDADSLMATPRVGGVLEVPGYRGGTREATRRLKHSIRDRLPRYATERNEPTPYQTSELSAHLYFGDISPLTIALAVSGSDALREDVDADLEALPSAASTTARGPSGRSSGRSGS